MDFHIKPSANVVCIDDAAISGIDCSSIPTNVELVMWHGPKPGGAEGKQEQGYGEILYNDRAAIRETFTDPSPYLGVINNWIKAAAGQLGPTPGVKGSPSLPHVTEPNPPPPTPVSAQQIITTAQALAIKNELSDALFSFKNQAPITYSGKSYDASNAEVAAMTSALDAALPPAIEAAMAALAASVNSANTTDTNNTNSTLGSYNTSVKNTTTDVNHSGSMANQLSASLAAIDGSAGFPIAAGSWSGSNPTMGTIAAPPTVPAPTLSGTVNWTATDGTSSNLGVDGMGSLLTAITARRATLQTNHLSLKTAMAALTTPVAVANYDITAGW